MKSLIIPEDETYLNKRVGGKENDLYLRILLKNGNFVSTNIHVKRMRFQHLVSLQLTLVVGKMCSVLGGTSFGRSFIYGATSKEINDVDRCFQKETNENLFKFGKVAG